MENVTNKEKYWNVCSTCKGIGKKRKSVRKNIRLAYQKEFEFFEKSNGKIAAPIKPKGVLQACANCKGTGLIQSNYKPIVNNEKYPHVAIIGGGIGGVALAVACLHRGIPFTLYERDINFDARSQGYGLTLQQASKAMASLGILSLDKGITSTRHVVHTTDGTIIGEWGIRKWGRSGKKAAAKHTNIHIARQSLRLALLEQLGEHKSLKWGHQLLSFEESEEKNVSLKFQVKDKILNEKADIVIGADGIRSTVRKLLIGDEKNPLRYLDCIVILGICPLKNLTNIESPLLDSETVFQTANGNERIYMMPYDADSIMWQLSFPLSEKEAKALNTLGAKALKAAACKRTQWHNPIPQIVAATKESQISGYPVYDRELLKPELLEKGTKVTLIGDAAHPMSPFKGQGANQALLDALSLARTITKNYNSSSLFKDVGLIKKVLSDFESEMIKRSASKVKGSAEAAKLLHSEMVLKEGNGPRGKHRK
ncbi:2-polyprenyl-6-methoxyphenol hydroxylase [Polaribacter sp. KT25b]|uniref:FAD-dependent oxidoreductase n=1 Tax=Polaribacter sp. KT25b TaxID=1855336 RepID=UPI00087BE0A3|nr:NAD(P)/FAD-dependent oxidoreductase [Polaribacter sp. KT25b]SDS28804.1 2-polyprenyl-6-methoxyphenol hydroxylase [Polaribacter sp. KT25b]